MCSWNEYILVGLAQSVRALRVRSHEGVRSSNLLSRSKMYLYECIWGIRQGWESTSWMSASVVNWTPSGVKLPLSYPLKYILFLWTDSSMAERYTECRDWRFDSSTVHTHFQKESPGENGITLQYSIVETETIFENSKLVLSRRGYTRSLSEHGS